MRSGNVAIIGRTNVGKSTFLNAALGEPLAITSALPQTTRDPLLGVVTLPNAQIAFVDTPGIHRPRNELGRRMNAAADDALRAADVVLVMTDTHRVRVRSSVLPRAAQPGDDLGELPAADLEVIERVPSDMPAVLVINKVDRCADKRELLPTIDRFAKARDFVAILPASALAVADVQRILGVLAEALPERAATFDEDTLTDRPALFFVREYVREQVLRQTGREVPHAVAVTVDSAIDRGDVLVVQATVHVEKTGQRGILIGSRGARLRDIGTAARQRIEALLGRRVFLELFVRVTPRWKHVARQLAELGYEAGATAPTPPSRAKSRASTSSRRHGARPGQATESRPKSGRPRATTAPETSATSRRSPAAPATAAKPPGGKARAPAATQTRPRRAAAPTATQARRGRAAAKKGRAR
jgi:GTP-binding protein Era